MANSVDPDQMLHSAAPDLSLHCLHRPVCPVSKGYYGNQILLTCLQYVLILQLCCFLQ